MRVPFGQQLFVFRGKLPGFFFFFLDFGSFGFELRLGGFDFFFAGVGVDHQLENLVFVGGDFFLGELNFVQQCFVLVVGFYVERLVAILGNFSAQVVDGGVELLAGGFVGFDRGLRLFEFGLGAGKLLLDDGDALGNSATSSCRRRISLSASCSLSRFSMSGSIDYLLILTRGERDFGPSDEKGWRRFSSWESVQPLQAGRVRRVGEGCCRRRTGRQVSSQDAGETETSGGVVHFECPDQLPLTAVGVQAIDSCGQAFDIDDQGYFAIIGNLKHPLVRLYTLHFACGRAGIEGKQIGKGLVAAHDQELSIWSCDASGALGGERLKLARSVVK